MTGGARAIRGAGVEAKVVGHLKGDKVIVFKKKRRKGYRVKNGHRQSLTELMIEKIVATGAKPVVKAAEKPAAKASTPAKPAAEKKAPAKAAPKKATAAPKAEKVTPAKKAPAKAKDADFASMTVAQLKAVAKEKGIAGYTSMKKAELLAALSK